MEHKHTKSIRIAATAAAVIFVLSLVLMAGMLYQSKKGQAGRTVMTIQEGEVLYTFDPERMQDQEIVITAPGGGTNTITIREGEVCVSQADCPDQICVKSGMLRPEGLPIVCLPHHLMIQFEE